MSRWLHAYDLKVGSPVLISSSDNGSFTTNVDINTNIQQSKNKANAYELSTHQITFSMMKDNNKEPNHGEVAIYNASDDIVNYITNNIANHVAVILKAGYVGGVKTIFSGTVEKISDKKEGTDRVTTLTCKDGAVNITEAATSRSYPKATPYKNIFTDLASDLGTPVGAIVLDSTVSTIPGPISIAGSTSRAMSNLATSINHNFSIQNGSTYVTPKTKKMPREVLYISATSGLIGSPEPLTQHEGKSDKNNNPANGIKFKCQLDGAITPETTIYVKSDNYDSAFKVIKVEHKGDFEGNEWCSEVQAVYVSNTSS